ncbi:MAG TPA: S8 family serine peptidase, partial [Candidatus Kapabacteria bacterium]|nr:S8 family serine peptidase [Candidatus Kapabacteria bacterium]
PSSASKQVSALSEIEYSEPNYIFHTDLKSDSGIVKELQVIKVARFGTDSLYQQQWAHFIMDVPGAWKYTRGDTSVHIGFIDTGVEWDHPDLVGQFAVNPAEDINHNGLFDPWPVTEKHLDSYGDLVTGDIDGIDNDGNGYVDDIIGYNFVDQEFINFGDAAHRDPFPVDEESHFHGTGVAGTIAAKANNGIGIAGIAPNCRLVALRALDATGNGESDDIATALAYAADNGVRIVNMSFGDIFSSQLLRDAINYAASKNVLVVTSSGNQPGGDGRHYPSDYDNCLSVGQTGLDQNGNEYLDPSGTVHGEGMDIIAPGVNVWVLNGGGSYIERSGTSYSSPGTAAVAALLLSKNPKLSNTELRSILETTTDFLTPEGYDHTHANGRVNARRALEFVGSASIKIASPHTDDGFTVGKTITISGDAASTLFKSYSLSVAKGLNPDRDITIPATWLPIASSDKQVINGTLGTWNTNGFSGGTYTLRLAVTTTDSRSVEERMNISLEEANPLSATVEIDTIFYNERRALMALLHGDSITTATLYYKAATSSTWLAKNDDNRTHAHAIVLTPNEIALGTPLTIKAVIRSDAGDSTSFDLSVTIPNEAFSQNGFLQKPYSLPGGYVLDTVVSDASGSHVLENVFSGGSDFGTLAQFSFDKADNKFKQTDSIIGDILPRSVGNTQGSGKPEILLQGNSNSFYIYRPNANHSVLGDKIFADTTSAALFATTLADIDGDGKDEIIGRATGNGYAVDKLSGGTLSRFGTLPNNTPPKPHYASNQYSIPEVRAADFLGDGKKELAMIDDDADLSIYKFDNSATEKFTPFFTDLNDGYTESRNIATGDYNGDGKPDIALAYHGLYDANDENEYDPSFWTVKVFLNQGGGNFNLVYRDHFYLARSNSPYRSSIGSIHNVTGGNKDELALSFFPNFYLLEYDDATATMKPSWHFPVSNSPVAAIAFDFDGNGKREFGFVAGDSIRFFEREIDLASRTPFPTGLEVIPRSITKVDLKWSPVSGATMYYILRSADNQFEVIDSTSKTEFTDSTVNNGDIFTYSVEAYNTQYSINLSEPAPGIQVFVHATPRVVTLTDIYSTITLHSSQPLSTRELNGAEFVIDDSITPVTAFIAGDSTIVITLPSPPTPLLEHSIRIRSFGLRDIWNSPFDTSALTKWTQSPAVSALDFYIVRWRFEGSTRIHVEFSNRPDDNALIISNYTLSPYGKLLSVERDPANDSAMYITIASGTNLRPLGTSFVLCINNVTSNQIPLNSPTGDCVGETLTAASLSNIFVYPNPVRSLDESLTFAGLTSHAEITIYTQNMRLIKHLETTEKTGGVKWDMRDEVGNILPSGVYLYHVTGKDDAGKDVEPNESKFVIIRTN